MHTEVVLATPVIKTKMFDFEARVLIGWYSLASQSELALQCQAFLFNVKGLSFLRRVYFCVVFSVTNTLWIFYNRLNMFVSHGLHLLHAMKSRTDLSGTTIDVKQYQKLFKST